MYEFIDIDLDHLEGSIVKETSWEPIKSPSSSFPTGSERTFFELSPDRLTVFDKAQARRFLEKGSPAANPLAHWLPSIITLLIVVLSLSLGYFTQNESINQFLFYLCIPSLCLFPLVTIAAIIFSIQLKGKYSKFPIFDRLVGSYWVTKDLDEIAPAAEAEIADLGQVHAIQLLVSVEYTDDDGTEYRRYQLNFVLQDATRVFVRGDHYTKDAIWADAEQIGSFLDVPVWNYIQNESD